MSQLLIGFLSLVAVGFLFTPAQATDVVLQCGDTVGPGGSFRMIANVGPCDTAGITVDSATLNMNHLAVLCNGRTFSGVTVIGSGAVVKNGQASGCLNGFEVQGSGHTLKGNVALGNVEKGFEVLGGDTKLIKNTAGTSGQAGFHVGQINNVLKKNNSASNSHSGYDIQSSGNTLTKNTASSNGDHGIFIRGFFGNTVSKNTATGNTAEDLFDGNGNCVSNTWKHNTFGTKNPNCIQ